MSRILDIVGLSLFLLVASISPAHAATLTQVVDLGPVSGNSSTDFVFDQFDSSLGTLDSVTIEFQGVSLNGFQLNTLDSPESFQIPFSEQAVIAGPNGEPIYTRPAITNSASRPVPPILPLPSSDKLGHHHHHHRKLKPKSFSGSYTWDQTMDLGGFIGTGTLNIPLLASASYTPVVDAAGQVFGGSQIWAFAELTYNYTPASPVPEPGIYVLLLAGLSFTWLRFRNKAC